MRTLEAVQRAQAEQLGAHKAGWQVTPVLRWASLRSERLQSGPGKVRMSMRHSWRCPS